MSTVSPGAQLVEQVTNALGRRGYRPAPATKTAIAEGRYNALTYEHCDRGRVTGVALSSPIMGQVSTAQ